MIILLCILQIRTLKFSNWGWTWTGWTRRDTVESRVVLNVFYVFFLEQQLHLGATDQLIWWLVPCREALSSLQQPRVRVPTWVPLLCVTTFSFTLFSVSSAAVLLINLWKKTWNETWLMSYWLIVLSSTNVNIEAILWKLLHSFLKMIF